MPAAISVAELSYVTPDGRTLLSRLNLQFGPVRTGLVGRNGVGKTTLLRLIEGVLSPSGGTITREGRIGVLRQAVQVGGSETVADLMGVTAARAVLARAEAGEADADELSTADWTLEARIAAALAEVGLPAGPDTRLAELSGGQRTRAALAALTFGRPDFILLDEPTNNLDAEGRQAVAALLAGWRGGAIVVSHDRALLDAMDAIVEMTTLGAASYGGNWSRYRELKALELEAARHDLAAAERQVTEAARRAQQARERQARRDAGGRRVAARGDMPKILLGARRMSAEATAGAGARLAERQSEAMQRRADAAHARVEVLTPFAIALPPTGVPAGRVVFRVRDLGGGYDPERPVIEGFSLDVVGPERLAITGPNGAGKTTLLNLIAGRLRPLAGTVARGGSVAMLDQQVSLLDPRGTILSNFRRLNPESTEHDCRAVLAAFMFRAEAALQPVASLSGGQMLRAGLACVLGGTTPPALLILDEPTNHLDIESIEVVEAGLRAYDGALIVASHDRAFLDAIGVEREVEVGGRAPPVQGRRASRSTSRS